MLKTFLSMAAAAALLAGCQTTQDSGTPGLIGGAINAQYGAGNAKLADSGPLLGAFIGKELSTTLDKSDLPYLDTAAKRSYAAAVGERVTWSNPQTGNNGTIATTRAGYNSMGAYCREYQQTVTVGKQTELAYGTACKQADGAWKIIRNS